VVSAASRGASRVGCLFSLLLLVAAGYFAVNVGEPYVRYLRYKDAMAQEARFASRLTDEAIRHRLREKADSLGLPEAAREIGIQRTERQIAIWADYSETVEIPLVVRQIHFAPRVDRQF
jgi:hypothetical protein